MGFNSQDEFGHVGGLPFFGFKNAFVLHRKKIIVTVFVFLLYCYLQQEQLKKFRKNGNYPMVDFYRYICCGKRSTLGYGEYGGRNVK